MHKTMVATLALCLSASCADSGPDPLLTVAGHLAPEAGVALADESRMVLWWQVRTTTETSLGTSVRYRIYHFGDGVSSQDYFAVDLFQPPPAEAISETSIGMAFVISIKPELEVVEGWVDVPEDREQEREFLRNVHGVAQSQRVFYRPPGAPAVMPAMPEGYSCGQCVDGQFLQTSCDTLTVTVNSDPRFGCKDVF